MPDLIKCACESCQCAVSPGQGIARDGKIFCSQTCAYDCTEQTCLCIHERCDQKTPITTPQPKIQK